MCKKEFVNKEYEARAMLSEDQYNALMNYYNKCKTKKVYSTNTNNYFDYDSLYLTDNHIVLRTRNISDKNYELTLKIKEEKCDLEHNLVLTLDEYNKINESAIIPDSEIKDIIIEKWIDLKKLKRICSLKTERLEVNYKKYLFVIDKNYYRDKVDYNVEVESFSRKSAQLYLAKKTVKFGVIIKKGYVSKSKRAIYNI